VVTALTRSRRAAPAVRDRVVIWRTDIRAGAITLAVWQGVGAYAVEVRVVRRNRRCERAGRKNQVQIGRNQYGEDLESPPVAVLTDADSSHETPALQL
jgi:hypothetical protein